MTKVLLFCGSLILAGATAHASTLAVSDFSFENYSVGAGSLKYSGSFIGYVPGWSFTSSAGIAATGSAFNVPTPVPNGTQAAFLQDNSATVAQTIGGFSTGITYTLDLFVGTRFASGSYDGNAGVNFLIDGVQIGTTGTLASSTPFAEYLIPFTVTSGGTHVLSLTNFSAAGDHTAFVDDVAIKFTSTGIPEPATMVLFGSSLVVLGFLRRRSA